MPQPEYSAITYLLHVLLDAYLYVIILRLVMQYVGVSYYNPAVNVCLILTNWAVKPLRKIAPGFKGVDFAIVLFWIVVAAVKVILLTWLDLDAGFPNVVGMIIWLLGDFLDKFLDIYLGCFIVRAVMSWVPALANNALGELVFLITEPVQGRVRRIVPPVGAIDFSPLLLLIGIYLMQSLLVSRLLLLGMHRAIT
ncbi:MAG: hypothetical protein A3F17_01425 [Gammaproteobacteria bacterium RIFCSPHIGHO2_12_FULL_41_15]|nr:MAG: hypothetical protein A3F17_01425 [Gammaproteobacteria bacterium RIFCSPHIGHO2_12_FULL_41_15]